MENKYFNPFPAFGIKYASIRFRNDMTLPNRALMTLNIVKYDVDNKISFGIYWYCCKYVQNIVII